MSGYCADVLGEWGSLVLATNLPLTYSTFRQSHPLILVTDVSGTPYGLGNTIPRISFILSDLPTGETAVHHVAGMVEI